MARIGLVAGEGTLPLLFAREAKKRGDTVIAFCLKHVTREDIASYVDKAHWFEWGDLKKAMLLIAVERTRKIVLLGKLKKEILFNEEARLDHKAREVITSGKDRKDYAVLQTLAKTFSTVGVEILPATTYLDDYVPKEGTLTKRAATPDEREDIAYGCRVARVMADFDIGQTIAVKDKTVIAVEAVEGTNMTIERSAALIKGGFVVVKMARSRQDMRFDVPLVGLETIEALVSAGGTALALESGKMLLIDREEVIKYADKNNISIVVV